MIRLGVDAHKRTHTIVAIDDAGRVLDDITVQTTVAGHVKAVRWAEQLSEDRCWALEDCRHLTRRLEQDLIRAGEAVVRVPPRLMGQARRGGRKHGKSDPIDAEAVAIAALRNPQLAAARLDGPERTIRLLVDHREDLVAERTRIHNRIHWHLHELRIDDIAPKTLNRYIVLNRLRERLAQHDGTVALIAAELIERCRDLTMRINDLEREITELTAVQAPTLLALPGCGALTAAKLIGESAGVERFSSKGAFAMVNGTAPIPVWSSNRERFRLNRGGNRQLNVALHRIAITQMRIHPPARAYIDKKLAEGKTKTEAIRALRRRLSDVVYRAMIIDQQSHQPAPATCVALAA